MERQHHPPLRCGTEPRRVKSVVIDAPRHQEDPLRGRNPLVKPRQPSRGCGQPSPTEGPRASHELERGRTVNAKTELSSPHESRLGSTACLADRRLALPAIRLFCITLFPNLGTFKGDYCTARCDGEENGFSSAR